MTATIDNTTTIITQNRNTLHKDMVMNLNDDFDNPQLINTEQPYPPPSTSDYYKKIENIFIEILITKYKGTDSTLRQPTNKPKLLITQQIKNIQ